MGIIWEQRRVLRGEALRNRFHWPTSSSLMVNRWGLCSNCTNGHFILFLRYFAYASSIWSAYGPIGMQCEQTSLLWLVVPHPHSTPPHNSNCVSISNHGTVSLIQGKWRRRYLWHCRVDRGTWLRCERIVRRCQWYRCQLKVPLHIKTNEIASDAIFYVILFPATT